jgi:hypothetical protein
VPSDGRHGEYYEESGERYFAPAPEERQRGRTPTRLERGRFEHHEDLAERLVRATNDLCLDMHHNYSRNRGFDETYRDAYRILRKARSMERKEDRGDQGAIRRSVEELDELFHDVESDVRRWRRTPARQVGRGDLEDKLARVESILHHLAYDVGITPDHDREHQHPQAPPPSRR